MNNSPVKSELYVALEMVELTQFLPFTNFSIYTLDFLFIKQSVNFKLTVMIYKSIKSIKFFIVMLCEIYIIQKNYFFLHNI